jgi:hypothetical protein
MGNSFVGSSRDEFLPSVGIHELESNIWWLLYAYDAGALAWLDNVWIDDSGIVCCLDLLANTLTRIDLNAVATITPCPDVFIAPYNCWSTTKKFYVAVTVPLATSFTVFRFGLDAFNRDTSLDVADSNLAWYSAISPNGKFIVIIAQSFATGNPRHVLVYKGA